MYQVVKIGDKDVEMLAMASVDGYYKSIFGVDPLKLQQSLEDEDGAGAIEFIQKMGYVMAKFAELKDRKEMLKLNEGTYWEWMDQFSRIDYLNALADIKSVYNGEKITTSKEKKRTAAK